MGEAKKRGDKAVRVQEAVAAGRFKGHLETVPGHFEWGFDLELPGDLGLLPEKTLVKRLIDRIALDNC